MALIVLFLAVGSSAAEWAVFSGGVGLSGVGYGLFGMLWVLSKTDRRFAGAIDTQTVVIFVAWLFLSILTTIKGTMNVANVAHVAGALLGANLGWITGRPRHRTAAAAVAGLAFCMCLLGASVLRPYVNFSDSAWQEYAYAGYQALTANQPKAAVGWLQEAVRYHGVRAGDWYNLGLAYEQLGQRDKAMNCFQQARRLDPSDASFKEAIEDLRQ